MQIKDFLYARRILMNFFNVFISVKEGFGGSLMHVYVWEHIAFLTEPIDGRDEVIMALHMRLGFSAKSAQRWIQVGVMFIVCA